MSDYFVFDTNKIAFGEQQNVFKCSGYGLRDLIKGIKKPVGLEIGCDIGDTSDFLLENHPELSLFTIDPYENYVDWNGRPLNEREEIFVQATQRLSKYGDRFTLIRKTSDDAVTEFKEEMFDFIFIDGLHTYEQLSKDCVNYYKFLKPGGIFSGHDFMAIEGVNRAAKEFASTVSKKISVVDCDVWYWYK